MLNFSIAGVAIRMYENCEIKHTRIIDVLLQKIWKEASAHNNSEFTYWVHYVASL